MTSPAHSPLHRLVVSIRTIRVRLTLWFVMLLAIILVTFSAFLYLTLAHNLDAELNRSLGAEAQRIIASIDLQDGQPALNGEFDPQSTGIVVALYSRTGTQLMDTNARPAFLRATAALAQRIPSEPTLATVQLTDGTRWRVLTMPVIEEGRVAGVLQVGRSEEEISRALGQLVTLMAIAIPATILFTVAGGLFLAGRALNPIDQITRTAERLGAQDLSQRLNLRGTDDEVGRLAATFDGMLERLDRAFRRQREFTADASHELRTPLASLISQVELALERSRTPAEYRRVLTSVRDDARRMTQLLNDLLTLARADDGNVPLIRETLELGELAKQVVAAMEPLARERGVTLERCAGETVFVNGDQTRLAQLMINLVDNGLKYTPTGGRVTIRVSRRPGQAIIEVSDTGVGITAEHLPHIFERFYRVDRSRSRSDGGTGLGLSICRWIVEAHGGAITVSSLPGQGTTFTVMLPDAVP